MKLRLFSKLLTARRALAKACQEEKGEVNIIAIILIIIVVIALVAIFRTQLTGIVNGLFDQIKNSLGL